MTQKTGIRKVEQYQDMIPRIFPNDFAGEDGMRKMVRTVTFQVTDACNLACKYCYQINKGKRRMPIDIARRFVDYLLLSTPENNPYINSVISPAVIVEFIGGEPFLEITLINEIVDYWMKRCIELRHPWAENVRFSICSNGVLYFTKEVQDFLQKWRNKVSFSISIDGNKELHDSCRVFPDGSPSYDIAVAGALDYTQKGGYMGSKTTLAPENLTYTYQAIRHMYELGYRELNANCVYEADWTIDHARLFYQELKKLADFFLAQNDAREIDCSLFEETFFRPMEEGDNQNWCGGTGMMLSCDPEGRLYPCIRYMESSLGCTRKPIIIGDVWRGIGATKEQKNLILDMQTVTRKSQSTDECFYCPIAAGCSWCSAYNYQETGSYNKRVTKICIMHKARALANIYYWNRLYKKLGWSQRFKINIPKEWAMEIISEDEWNLLLQLENKNQEE